MIKLTCIMCSTEFTRKLSTYLSNIRKNRLTFCSHYCSTNYRKHTNETHPTKFCKSCGMKTRSRTNLCMYCRQFDARELVNYTVRQIKDQYSQKSLLAFAAKIRGYGKTIYNRSNKPKYCVACGYNKHYEVCHIKPIKTFPDTATMSEVHHLDNLIALCPNCHWEFDNGLLRLKE